MPPAIPAAIGAAGSIFGGLMSGSAAQDAANAQLQAAQLAAQTQLQMYNQTRGDLMPWMTGGGAAQSQLMKLWGLGPGGTGIPDTKALTTALTNFPGYQFGLNQGQTALDRSASSRGLLLSGAQLKASQQFGQDYGMEHAWMPYLNQLNSMSALGEDAGAKTGALGVQYGGNIGSAQLAGGSAQAAGIIGANQGLMSGLQGAYQAFGGGGGFGGGGWGGWGGGGGWGDTSGNAGSNIWGASSVPGGLEIGGGGFIGG